MKSIIYSVVAIFTLVCFALAQQAPDSVAYDSNPSLLYLRAQRMGTNGVFLTWRGTAPGVILYRSIGHGIYAVIATLPHGAGYGDSGLMGGVPYIYKVCDWDNPQTCSNEVRVLFPR